MSSGHVLVKTANQRVSIYSKNTFLSPRPKSNADVPVAQLVYMWFLLWFFFVQIGAPGKATPSSVIIRCRLAAPRLRTCCRKLDLCVYVALLRVFNSLGLTNATEESSRCDLFFPFPFFP